MKRWTALSMCRQTYYDWIAEVQRDLSKDGEKKLPYQKYGILFPKRINKTVKGLQLSGTKCKPQKMFSESK